MPKLKVSIDRGKCVGSGNCVYIAPEVFRQSDDDGIAILLTDEPLENLSRIVADAGRQCPSMAIKIEEI